MSGLKTLTWRTLSVAALLLSANIASADFLFGYSGFSDANSLTVNGVKVLTSGENQGWWSPTSPNSDGNTNYFVGSIEQKAGTDFLNNFFIFDITPLATLGGPVTSAVLNLQFFSAYSSTGASSITYGLFDVTTDLADVDFNEGISWSIFNDLGTGKSYGTFSVATWFPEDYVLSLTLNSTALADLNDAVAKGAEQFGIGGTLLAPTPADNSVPDSANSLALFGGAAAALWALRRKKSV